MNFRRSKNSLYKQVLIGFIPIVLSLSACKKDSGGNSSDNSFRRPIDRQSYERLETPLEQTTQIGVGHIGGADTGGGDGQKSTPQEVLDALNLIKKKVLPTAFYRVSRIMEPIHDNRIFQPQESFPEDLRPVFEALFNGNSYNSKTIYQDIKETQWRAVVDGPCKDKLGRPHDASVQEDGRMCFSIPRLVKIPAHILIKELTALAAHEHIHRYDFWEEGIEVQNFFLRTTDKYQGFRNFVNPDSSTLRKMTEEIDRVRLAAQELQSLLIPGQIRISKGINKIGSVDLIHEHDLMETDLSRGKTLGSSPRFSNSQEDEQYGKRSTTKANPRSIWESIQEASDSDGDGPETYGNVELENNADYTTVKDIQIPDVMICSHIGRLSGLLSNIFGGGDGIEHDSRGEGVMLHPNYWVLTGKLSQRVAGAFAFCGFSVAKGYGVKADRVHIEGPYFQTVELGDREHLKELVDLVKIDAFKFFGDVIDYFYAFKIGIGKNPEDLTDTIKLELADGQSATIDNVRLEGE